MMLSRLSKPEIQQEHSRFAKFSNEEEPPVESRLGTRKEKFRSLFFLLPVVFFFIAFVISCVLLSKAKGFPYKENKEASEVMKYLQINFHSSPYEEIKMKRKGEICEIGYSSASLGKFLGFNQGCLCDNGQLHSKAYCWLKKSIHCKIYNGKAPQALHAWKSFHLCVKPYSSYKFITDNSECSGMKKCQDFICVAGGAKCPVTEFTISKIPKNPPSTSKEHQDVFGYRAIVNRDTVLYPIIGFNYGNAKPPCIISSREPELPFKAYPLNTVKTKGCGRYGDLAIISKEVDKYPYYTLLNDNEITKPDPPYLTTYLHDNYIASLFTIQRVPSQHTKQCYDIQSDKVRALAGNNDSLVKILVGFGVTILILSLAGLVTSILFLIRGKIGLRVLTRSKSFSFIVGIMLLVILLIVIMAICYWAKHSEYQISETKGHFQHLLRNKCLTIDPFKKAGQDIVNMSDMIDDKVSASIGWAFGISLLFLLATATLIFFRKKENLPPIPQA